MSCNTCAKQSATVMGASSQQTEAIFARSERWPIFAPSPIGRMALTDRNDGIRALTSVAKNSTGRLHCRTCGQFVSANGSGHVCPYTGNATELAKSVMRRTGIPDFAFGDGYFDQLFEKVQEKGFVSLIHPVTGDTIQVTLDALPLALSTGYQAEGWGFGRQRTYLVQNGKGQVYEVLMSPEELGMSSFEPRGAIEEAATAYAHAPMYPAISAAGIPAGAIGKTTIDNIATPSVIFDDDGSEYDFGRISGSEYRKSGYQGKPVAAGLITTGQVFKGNNAKSSFRQKGIYPSDRDIRAGRVLPEAAWLLASNKREIVILDNNQVIEVYRRDAQGKRGELTAVLDARKHPIIVGSTDGETSMNAEMMVAMGAWLAHYRGAEIFIGGENLIKKDWDAAKSNPDPVTIMALADSIYVGSRQLWNPKNPVFTVPPPRMGAIIRANRCSQCGRFVGSVSHDCPVQPQQQTTVTPQQPQMQPTSSSQTPSQPTAPSQSGAPQPEDESNQSQATTIPDYTFATAGAWTWVKFPDTPAEEFRSRLKDMGFRWSIPKQGWRRRGHDISEEDVENAMFEAARAVSETTANADEQGNQQYQSEEAPSKTRIPPKKLTAQEKIFAPVLMPAPDPALKNVPKEWGGQRESPIEQEAPAISPNFMVDDVNEHVLAAISAGLQVSQQINNPAHSPKFRSFGLYGPPAGGKNMLARQVAASIRWVDQETGEMGQGIPYTEVNITDKSTKDEVIGGVVLVSDGMGGTRSEVRLGPAAAAAAAGSVVCINEIVRNEKLATSFQAMIEDGVISIETPEAGTITIPVHPSTVFVMTWNPGLEGDSDRPALAALSRMATFRMPEPTDEQVDKRIAAQMEDMFGSAEVSEPTATLRATYKIPSNDELRPFPREIKLARDFWRLVQGAAEDRKIGQRSFTPTTPRMRDLARFIVLGKTIGYLDAVKMFQIFCDQDEDFEGQWQRVMNLFTQVYGTQGTAGS